MAYGLRQLHRRNPRRARAGFTLIELIVAGLITTFILSTVSLCLSQIGRVKNTSKLRFDAFMRADSALNQIRREITSTLRTDDLFYTRILLLDDSVRVRDEILDRDELLVFNNRIRPLRNIEFSGEGSEYETQIRISDDDYGPVLWTRHDPLPDEFPAGGGVATPDVEGILGLTIEAYNSGGWTTQWDSDVEGIPVAIRVSVLASGHRGQEDIYTAPRAMLRAVISLDRVLPPKDLTADEGEDENAAGDEAGDGTDPTGNGGDGAGTGGGGNGGGGGIGGGGGGRPGGGGGGRPGGGGGGRPGGGTGNTGGGGGRPGGGTPGTGMTGGGGGRP